MSFWSLRNCFNDGFGDFFVEDLNPAFIRSIPGGQYN